MKMRKSNNVEVYEIDRGNGRLSKFEVDAFFFPGGEPHVNAPDTEEVRDARFVVRLYGGSFEDVALAVCIAKVLLSHGSDDIDIFAPYFPGARQDKAEPFTYDLYYEFLYQYFTNILVVDPHSPVTARLEAVKVLPTPELPLGLFEYKSTAWGGAKTFCMISPDEGATERTRAIAARYNLPVVQARKVRDPEDNFRIKSIECDPIPYDYAIVVDDICDGGGTFLGLADATGLNREQLRLWTTHGIYSKGTDELYNRYSFIASTDSIKFHSTAINAIAPLFDTLQAHYSKENS